MPEPVGRFGGLMRKLFGDDGMSFKDVLDLVNPLHHIPVVGHVYRELTGDEIAPAVQVAGGALFGGPLGAALSVAGLVVERGRAAVAEDEQAPAPLTPAALADTAPAEPPRGGWLIAAASSGALPPFVPVSAAVPPTAVLSAAEPAATQPRGGWMLAAAQAVPPRASAAAAEATVDGRTGAPDAVPAPAAPLAPAGHEAPEIALRHYVERVFAMTVAWAEPEQTGHRLTALA